MAEKIYHATYSSVISTKITIKEEDLEKHEGIIEDVNKTVFKSMFNRWKEEAENLTYDNFVKRIKLIENGK